MLDTVKVPAEFEPVFQKAQEYVSRYFREIKREPSQGTIEISGERYILVRAASMSVDFFDTVLNLYRDRGKGEAINVARQMLFDIAHAIGRQDARNFHSKMELKDPIAKLSAGPVFFAYAGWAFVDIFPESKPSPDENYYLVYDHPYSFEAEAWERNGKKADFPVCIMNAGYSSGWCEESFGVTLVASEIMCKANGDDACRFIMGHPSRMENYISEYMKKKPELADRIASYEIPGFFKAKQMEERLKIEKKRLGDILDSMADGVTIVDMSGKITDINKATVAQHGYAKEEVLGRIPGELFMPQSETPKFLETLKDLQSGREVKNREFLARRKDGKTFSALISCSLIMDNEGKPEAAIVVHRDITERKKMEDDLVASAARYKSYLEVTGQIGWTTPADGFVDDVPEWRKYTGQTAEEVKGWGWLNAIHPDDRERTAEIWNKAVSTKSTYEVEYRVRRYDGVYRYFLARGIPSLREDGTIREWVGTCIDITEHQKLREDIERRSSVLNAINRLFENTLTCETEAEVAAMCLNLARDITQSEFGFIGELISKNLFDTLAIDNPGWDVCNMPQSEAREKIVNMPLRGIDRATIKEGKSRIVNEPENHPDRMGVPDGHPPVKCFLGVPLKQGEKTVGMIGLANRKGGYTPDNQRDVESLSAAFVEALHHKRTQKAVEQSRAELEGKVVERTRDLQKKLDELEHFRKATIDREFRMEEMRREIEELKKKFKQE